MDDFLESFIGITIGVGVIALAPLAVATTAVAVATTGAIAVTTGGISTAAAVELGVTACTIAESSTYALGGKIISDSINR